MTAVAVLKTNKSNILGGEMIAGNIPESSNGGTLGMGTLKGTWEKISHKLKAELGEDLYSSWFARMQAEHFENGNLRVSVPTRFLKNWVENHYFNALKRVCSTELSDLDEIIVSVRARGVPHNKVSVNATEQKLNGVVPSVVNGSSPAGVGGERGSPIDANLSFETFVCGKSNALANAAALRVADTRSGDPLSFNPLYIHSLAGLGKTHLLNAVSSRIRQTQPERKVLYITAERFMYHFVAALKNKDVISFKDFFQSIDVLLVDDFQFLQGKTMQQEFCHTINSLIDRKAQVVIAADVPPSQLGSIDQRMRSRFAGGLVVDISPPEPDLRRAILHARLTQAQLKDPSIYICNEVLEFIAGRVNGGGRELEGALNRVIASQQLTKSRITVDMAAFALRDVGQENDPVRVRIDDIIRIIGQHYAVTRSDLLSARRARSIVRPRQVGMYLAKKLTPRSLPEIGKRFGGRDHSTVLHAVRKVEELMAGDEKLAREVNLLAKMVEQGQA